MDRHFGRQTYYQLAALAIASGLVAGVAGGLVAQPAGNTGHPGTVTIGDTSAAALDVAGGAEFGSGDVALIGADGRIIGPLSSIILTDLSGANLTGLNGSRITTGTVAAGRIANLSASKITSGTFALARLANTVGTGALRTASGSTSGTGDLRITMHEYSFVPAVEISTSNNCDTRDETRLQPYPTTGSTSTAGTFTVRASSLCTVKARWRYITASDTPSIWAVVDPTGAMVSLWEAEDPVSADETVAPLATDDATHRVVNMGVPSVAVITTLATALTADQQADLLTRLEAYIAAQRGWPRSRPATSPPAGSGPCGCSPRSRGWRWRSCIGPPCASTP